MTTNRAVGLVGFVVCAGITGVWGLITPERLYTFFLAGGVVFFIYLKLGNAPRDRGGHDPESMREPEAMRDIYNVGYAQGIAHGLARARAEGGEGAHTRVHGSHLPKVG